MPDPIIGTIAGSIGSSLIGSSAASSAADSQAASSAAGIAATQLAQQQQRETLAPYTQAGIGGLNAMTPYSQAGGMGLNGMLALAGLSGVDAQRSAIEGLSSSPELQALMSQGENAMRQNASATGGLRGGNLQGMLAQYRPQMLQDAITQQYSRLGGLAGMGANVNQSIAGLGQASAAGTGAAGMQSAGTIAQLLQQQGAAQAGGAIGQGAAWSQLGQLPMQLGMMQKYFTPPVKQWDNITPMEEKAYL